jgi:hypothetical protein
MKDIPPKRKLAAHKPLNKPKAKKAGVS